MYISQRSCRSTASTPPILLTRTLTLILTLTLTPNTAPTASPHRPKNSAAFCRPRCPAVSNAASATCLTFSVFPSSSPPPTFLLHAPITAPIMTSDASLPPNAPTTPTPTMTTATNGSLTPQREPQSLQSNSLAQPPLDPAKAAGDVGGEADASAEFLDDEHDGTELDVPPNPVPLSEVCRDVNARVAAFLALDSKGDDAVRRTQEHVRESVDVLTRALDEYGYVSAVSVVRV